MKIKYTLFLVILLVGCSHIQRGFMAMRGIHTKTMKLILNWAGLFIVKIACAVMAKTDQVMAQKKQSE